MLKGLAAALIGTILVLATLGVALGMDLGNADLLNPNTSRAKANQMQQEADLQTERGKVDLEIYKQEEANRLELQRQQQLQELAYQRDRQQVELTLLRTREMVVTGVLSVMLILTGGGLTFCLVAIGRRIWAKIDSPAQLQEWRAIARRLARDNERLLRQGKPSQPVIKESIASGGNGHRKERVVI